MFTVSLLTGEMAAARLFNHFKKGIPLKLDMFEDDEYTIEC